MANSHSRMKLLNQYRQRTMPNYAPLVLMNLTANHANHADRKNHPRRGCSRGSSISRFTASGQCSGNLTNDGTWTLTWDAENRLVNMTSLSSGPARSKLKLDFSYDHQGRRIQKVVSTWNGSSYTSPSTNQFVYDGWNLLAELDTSHSALRTYVWGLDLSGTLQGAGGVGGLLAITDASQGSHFCAHDGNGNVTALVKADGSGQAAQYEYGPFGEPLRATGPMAKANPFRFSTKYQDDESDLIYYGYRYYNPSTGRWPNSDPMEEEGGFNLYGMVFNDPVNAYDAFGLQGKDGKPKPPKWDPGFWNTPANNNCCNYAYDRPGGWNNTPYNLQPGELDGMKPATKQSCDDIKKRVKADFPNDPNVGAPKDGKCPEGYHKIKPWVSADGWGFHMQRQDDDGKWSEKPGALGKAQRCNPNKPEQKGDKPCDEMCVPDAARY